jgi:hypothetical protein
MSNRKKVAKPVTAAAEPKRTRIRRAFLDSQLHAGRALKAFSEMGGVAYDPEIFRIHYERQSHRKRAFKNDPVQLRQRLAELENETTPPSVVAYTPNGTDEEQVTP